MARRPSPAHAKSGFKAAPRRRGATDRAGEIEALQDQVFSLTDQVEKMRTALSAAGDIVLRHGTSPGEPPQPIGLAYGAMFDLAPEALLAHLEATDRSDGDQPDRRDKGALAARIGDDLPLPTRTGQRWFTCSTLSLPGADGTPIRHTVLTDVTDRKAVEAALATARDSAEAASEAKSRFLALASHELRTPLNGILGMAGLLRDTALTPEQESYVQAITVSGEALLAIVGDVLDHARIEAGRLELTPSVTDPAAIVRDVVELLAPRAHAKAIELAADLGPGVPDRVLIDGSRLRQVLLNLAGNAIKFTEVGGVVVRTRLSVRGGDPRLVIAVEDTGIGLAPRDAERIFHEFEQADQGTARRADGTGLGLSIARAIVRAMGGEITLESALGRGSTFSFALPLGMALEPDARAARLELTGRRVLVIAEAAIEPPILCHRLAEAGAEVGRAPDLAAARVHWAAAQAAGRAFDTVLVDYPLVATTEGLETFAAFRTAMPTGVRAIVLLTPTDRGALDRLRARGVDGYLTRPVRQASLLAVLAHSDATDAAFAPDPRDRPHDAAVIAPPRTARAIDVLIVDDNPINALLARALVTRLGHRAHVVGDGMAALIAVKRGPQPGTDQAASARRDGRDRECDPGGEPTLEATARTTASGSNTADPRGLSAAPVDKSSVPGKTTATAGEGSGGPFARRYAAVLTDLHMPGRDGFELIRAIRADEARHGLAPARLIAVTADARPDVAVAVRAAGGDATLTKPFEPNHLAELLTFAAPGDPARPS